uniref:Tetratricopeptide repeat domain 16 n=1 Tax=Lates calcarifer TaxID=8187 RepID=A0A4W6CSI1_LATCA
MKHEILQVPCQRQITLIICFLCSYTNGKEAMEKFQFEKAVICFSKAITLQPEQLYVSQGEAYLQLCDFQSAATCYKKAWILEPGSFRDRLAFIYYLQGQCLFDRGLFLDALEAFQKAAEVKPGCRAHAVRSLACLTAAGHHTDCLQLVNDWMESDGPTSDLYILRARLHKQLHQTSQCYQDVKSALALNPTCLEAGALLLQLQQASEQARQKAVDRALTGQLPEALCMINIALENCPQDRRLYLFRGILYRRLKDFTAAIEDLVQAVELSEEEEGEESGVTGRAEARDKKDECVSFEKEVEFQLVLTYNDFAVQCFSSGLYAEATLLLNKAIEEEKSQAGLYLNRGDCFFKQGEWCYALADYQQAEEMMRPDDPAVRLRLAVLHNTLGSLCFQDGRFQEAADMFSLAVQYNPTAGRYYENRSKAFRKLLNFEGARQDFICMLILDPTNEESGFPLISLSENNELIFVNCVCVFEQLPTGQDIRVQLMDIIQAYSSFSEQQRSATQNPTGRLRHKSMTLTSENTASQSEDPCETEKELKLCVNQQEVEINVKSLLQVLMGKSSLASFKLLEKISSLKSHSHL